MVTAAVVVAAHALVRGAAWLAFGTVAAAVVAAVDAGDARLGFAATRWLGPAALAAGAAGAGAALRRRGDWAGWSALGIGPRRGLGLLLVAALLGLGQLAPTESGPLALPPPHDGATLGRVEGAWVSVDAGGWVQPPGELGVGALVSRARNAGPPGRRRVDEAELLRRAGLWGLWLLAVPWGLRQGRRTQPPLVAEAVAAGGIAIVQVGLLAAVGYTAMT